MGEFIADIVKAMARGFAAVLAPFALILVSVGAAGVGMEYEIIWLFWAGLIGAGVGVLWVIFATMIYGGD